ncbi:SEC-C domain-containing protein [uncultured Streptomyces sp.]|uniref:SEC-C domain-containing protein n=1 Tax=uncultured Streptomyces sp. TaxID=174707 RepID=UPI00262B306C|nr:SEC-C domain-containing protein [uncultured Streptomyces sp.]
MRPDTPAEHITEAERLLRTAALYPEDHEPLTLRAAAHLELAGERVRATALYDQLLAGQELPVEEPHLVKALKAANLWEYGHEAEARAIIEGIRAAAPREASPWEIAAETLEAHDELTEAEAFFSTALTLLLAPGEEVPYATQSLLTGRHRVRRLLGVTHDAWDELADTLHTAAVPLDELHDPKRLWSLGSSDPGELQAEIARLRAELGVYRTALSRPFPVAVLHWPEDELRELLAGYPELASEYVSHPDHLSRLEAALRDLHAAGTPNLGIVTGTVPSYEAFAASEAASPSDAGLLPLYATTLAARGRATPWPPPRSAPCWCGSGETYRNCHGGA